VLKAFKPAALLLSILVTGFWASSPALAGPLNVPDDFPGNFRMDLLTVGIFVDQPSASMGLFEATVAPSELGIDFSASAFDGTGTPTWGTSTLATIAQTFEIGSASHVVGDISLFIDSGGPGSLVDLGGGVGDWELTVPIGIELDGNQIALVDVTLSTSDTVSYYDQLGVLQSVSGVAMDYATGDALLVAQVMFDVGLPSDIRGTLVIDGNDPVLIPEPSTGLLLAAGLVGLVRLGRKR